MKTYLTKLIPLSLIFIILAFFYPFLLQGKIPIPADTIVGLYHPWRDAVWDGFTAGVPYKNYLITDPVRQQYVWRNLAIEEFKKGNLPSWNPYSFSGTPLAANLQTAAFYPLNILFFILPFQTAWGILIVLQLLIGGLSLYLFLLTRKISPFGSSIASIAFVFSGFSIAWLEWNTVIHTLAWLPVMLLSVEKLASKNNTTLPIKSYGWCAIFIFALCASFLAGHLQVFFYGILTLIAYIVAILLRLQKNKGKLILLLVLCFLLFVGITAVQWIPTLRFIALSAREFDQGSYLKEGWFIPWQHLIQFVVPDFFGNPATGNYWGIWNYAEFVGYIGVLPLILAAYALLFRKGKTTLFFGSLVFVSLLFSLPTYLAKLPFVLKIPLITTSQPTRLLAVTVFALCVLSAMGFEQCKKDLSRTRILAAGSVPFLILWTAWSVVLFNKPLGIVIAQLDLLVARKNLILPSLLFVVSITLLISGLFVRKRLRVLLYSIMVLFVVADLFRFGWKFTPFTKPQWIFPKTNTIKKLQSESDTWRVMATNRRIMAPNFSVAYNLMDVAGYDPLYLRSYGEMVASWGRGLADISPASFNRILTPDYYESFMKDLLGVKYVLSLTPLESSDLKLVYKEGETMLYENSAVFPRAFFVDTVIKVQTAKLEMKEMYRLKDALRTTAVSSDTIPIPEVSKTGEKSVELLFYSPDKVQLRTVSDTRRLLVITDVYYPTWQVTIDGSKSTIYRVDFGLRGVIVPEGTHTVEFRNNLI